MEAALERAGEDAWADLVDDDQRAAARRILLRLARREDDHWIARRQARDEVVADDDSAAAFAAEVLCDHRLLVAHADSLEVAHEALFAGGPDSLGGSHEAASSRRELDGLSTAARDWAAEDGDPALLLRGSRLVAASELAQARPEDLSASGARLRHRSAQAADAGRPSPNRNAPARRCSAGAGPGSSPSPWLLPCSRASVPGSSP